MKRIVRDEVLQSEQIAIVDDRGRKATYRQLAERAKKLSAYMEERSLIFILCDKQMETVEFLYEVIYLNRIPLLLQADIQEELLAYLISIYRPQYIYCRKGHAMARRYSEEIALETHMLAATGFPRYPFHPDVALLLSTSGTTGSSKLAKISYENLYNNAEYACMHLGMKSGQKGISPLPINYTYGIAFCFWHWHCGAALLVTEEPVIGKKFREFFKREGANNFAATPYTFRMLDKVKFWESEILNTLHFAMSGGAQMSESDQVYMISVLKEKFWIGYGQTECTCIISAMNFDEDNIKLGSIGKAFDNMKVILDVETNELCIKSKSVCMGYANDMEDMKDGDGNHGMLRTGDVAYIDEDGCIFLRGRLTRYIKILGKRTSLDDIEKYLANNFPDIECACTGKDDHITIFCKKGEEWLKKEMLSTLALGLKIPAQFISFRYMEKIPRNEAGKITYAEMR